MNVGNLDITATDQSVTLRMRHVVEGHPGCVLSFGETRTLIADLERLLARQSASPLYADGGMVGEPMPEAAVPLRPGETIVTPDPMDELLG